MFKKVKCKYCVKNKHFCVVLLIKYQSRITNNIKFFNNIVAVFNKKIIAHAQRYIIRTTKIVQQYITFQKHNFKNSKFEQQIKKLFVIFKRIDITFIDILNILRFYFVIEFLSNNKNFDNKREIFAFIFEFEIL